MSPDPFDGPPLMAPAAGGGTEQWTVTEAFPGSITATCYCVNKKKEKEFQDAAVLATTPVK